MSATSDSIATSVDACIAATNEDAATGEDDNERATERSVERKRMVASAKSILMVADANDRFAKRLLFPGVPQRHQPPGRGSAWQASWPPQSALLAELAAERKAYAATGEDAATGDAPPPGDETPPGEEDAATGDDDETPTRDSIATGVVGGASIATGGQPVRNSAWQAAAYALLNYPEAAEIFGNFMGAICFDDHGSTWEPVGNAATAITSNRDCHRRQRKHSHWRRQPRASQAPPPASVATGVGETAVGLEVHESHALHE